MTDLDALRDRFAVPSDLQDDKLLPLSEAVERLVRPGMTLEFGVANTRANGIVNELLRRFLGSNPGFAYVGLSLSGNSSLLAHAGLVDRAITTYCGDSYPAPGPSPILQAAITEGRLAVEHWTILTIPLRLKAAATGVPELPTHSLVGSTMAEENGDAFRERDGVGWVRPLVPDLAFFHGLAADRAGNVVLPRPHGSSCYGALAAREGALVTVEHVVSTEWIRAHADLVVIPASAVRAVCHAPLGGHPYGVYAAELDLEGYADDYPAMIELREACTSAEKADAWIRDWLVDPGSHEAYVEKLGSHRIASLRDQARPDAWVDELDGRLEEIRSRGGADPAERLVLEATREIETLVVDEGFRTFLAGVGTSNLAAWMAARRLRERGIDVSLMAEMGFFAYDPRPADPFIFNQRNLPTGVHLTDVERIMGLYLGSEVTRCIGVIGAAEIDRAGNINTTRQADGTPITGSGGGNDTASACKACVITAFLARGRFPERVAYVTSPGRHVRSVVTQRGTFRKDPDGDELVLATWVPVGELSEEECVREIRSRVGWDLRVAPVLERAPEPDPTELETLRLFDVDRCFLGKGR